MIHFHIFGTWVCDFRLTPTQVSFLPTSFVFLTFSFCTTKLQPLQGRSRTFYWPLCSAVPCLYVWTLSTTYWIGLANCGRNVFLLPLNTYVLFQNQHGLHLSLMLPLEWSRWPECADRNKSHATAELQTKADLSASHQVLVWNCQNSSLPSTSVWTCYKILSAQGESLRAKLRRRALDKSCREKLGSAALLEPRTRQQLKPQQLRTVQSLGPAHFPFLLKPIWIRFSNTCN